MSIEPINPLEPPSVVDGPWWPSVVRSPEPAPMLHAVSPFERDPRAEALGIAQHATVFIPGPLPPNAARAARRPPSR